jgi:ArsR family transcriptional regulator
MKQTKVIFSHDKLQYSCDLMRAMAHPLRLKILQYIDEKKQTPVNRIYNHLNIEQSITSQHLKILREAGVVHAKRDGKKVHYSVDYSIISKVNIAVNNFMGRSVMASQ